MIEINDEKINSKTGVGVQTEALLALVAEGEMPSLYKISVAQAREIFHPMYKSLAQDIVLPVDIDRVISSKNIKSVVITPKTTPPVNGWPTLIFIHGGGWALADFDCYAHLVKSISHYSQSKVVFLEYGLSPENKFPFALNQAHELLKYLHDNISKMNIDSTRLGLIGDSSGGNMALALSLLNRDSEVSYPLKMMCLCYPFLDLTQGSLRASRVNFGQGNYITSEEVLTWSTKQYIINNSTINNPLVSPLLDGSFINIPKTLIITAGFDPLLDENIELQKQLTKNSVINERLHFPSTIHGFLSYSVHLDIAQSGLELICKKINDYL
jgi:acetyl esterase